MTNNYKTKLALATGIIFMGPLVALAWTSAPANPPNSNVAAPLNAGSDVQSKQNRVRFNTDDNDYGLLVHGSTSIRGKVGIGAASPDVKLQVGENGDGSTVKASIFLYSSDARFKTDIATLSDALSKVLKLRGVSFNWKTTGASDVGVVAQEVERVFPELVSTDSRGTKSVEYGHLVAPLIEAIKAQQKQIESLEARIRALESKVK